MDKLWSVRELAETAGTSIQWVHDEIGRGKFPGIQKIGNSYVIPQADAIAWLSERGYTNKPTEESDV